MRSSFKMYGNFANISILPRTKSIDVFHSKISLKMAHLYYILESHKMYLFIL